MSNTFADSNIFCNDTVWPLVLSHSPLSNNYDVTVSLLALRDVCNEIGVSEQDSETEGMYSKPMVLIGIYISVASLFCILAMVLDLLYGFRNKKFWFPTKYFSLNAATITVIPVAMKLPVDLTSPMPGLFDQLSKVGGLAFMCAMMSNFMPSLASKDNKSLLANVIGLSILVITLVVNMFIQIRTHVINYHVFYYYFMVPTSMVMGAYIHMGILLFLLVISLSSAITVPTSKKILQLKYEASSKSTLNEQHPQESLISTDDKLRQLVKRFWIMAETGNPQFVMASNPLSFASGIICAVNMVMYLWLLRTNHVWQVLIKDASKGLADSREYQSVYKWSIKFIVFTQSIGLVVGSIAPIFRCFTLLSFKSFAKQNVKHFLVFRVEKYWTQKLCDWKESGISFLSCGRRSRALLHNSKNLILSFCIGFQMVTVVSCKIIGLIPIVVIIFVRMCLSYFKSLKAIAMMFVPLTASTSDDTNEDLSNYVLLLEDNMQLAENTMKGISNSLNRVIKKVEKKQPKHLLKLLETSVAFDGVETFDTPQIQSLLYHVELVNSWSLPVISLTCIAIALPNIRKDMVDNLLESVGEGLLYSHLVEESLNKASEYVNTRRATMIVWHEVENKRKWLKNTLERRAYEGKTPTEIIKSFAHTSEIFLNDFNASTNGEVVEKERLPPKVIVANSMYRIAQTILHTYESNNLEIIEDELFARLSCMIADILAACLTNIPRVIRMRCHEKAIEKREASVLSAIDLLGRTTEIIKLLEKRELPNMDPDKMGFIDEWRLHLKQP